MQKTFSIITMGCKLNQFDSELMRQSLLRRNWVHRPVEGEARVCIINSCTVTSRSDARCRNAVRRVRRASPDAFIVVTGCYAETQPNCLEGMAEVDLVLGNAGKESIAAALDRIAAGEKLPARKAGAVAVSAPGIPAGGIETFFGHARAFVKIQDGCDASCSYCIVPRARGRARSVPVESVLEQVRVLSANGYREMVLTGIHIGRFGADLEPPDSLAGLLEEMLRSDPQIRIRLSSLEPTEVNSRIIELMRAGDRIAPHLHIPLQSGDDRTLAAMSRNYRAAEFRAVIENVARELGNVAIGTDIIVGFPGETEERFENTFRLVHDLPFSYLHVFAFSSRPETAAAAMDAPVRADAARRRSRRLIELGASKRRAFLQSQVGRSAIAVIEGPVSQSSSFTRSLTGNYCEVLLPRNAAPRGTLARIRVARFSRGSLYGEIAAPIGAAAAPDRNGV